MFECLLKILPKKDNFPDFFKKLCILKVTWFSLGDVASQNIKKIKQGEYRDKKLTWNQGGYLQKYFHWNRQLKEAAAVMLHEVRGKSWST